MASSAGPAHRIMSDLSAFIGHRDPATQGFLAAGDLNLCYGATGGTLSLPTRARRRRRSRPVAACAAIAGARLTRWCVARGGGAGTVRGAAVRGRVGPPATPRRLCVLHQIGDQLVASVEQFLLVDDVVAVEDGAGLVAGQEHVDALGDTGADEVAGGGTAAIVEEAGRYASRLTGGAPRRAPAADRDVVAVKDKRTVGVAACLCVSNSQFSRENPPHLCGVSPMWTT